MCLIRENTKRYITQATTGSCEGMRRSLKSICVGLDSDEGIVRISSCDDQVEEPVEFCPFCGTPIEVEVYP